MAAKLWRTWAGSYVDPRGRRGSILLGWLRYFARHPRWAADALWNGAECPACGYRRCDNRPLVVVEHEATGEGAYFCTRCRREVANCECAGGAAAGDGGASNAD